MSIPLRQSVRITSYLLRQKLSGKEKFPPAPRSSCWQRPCYLMADGYAKTYKELVETTDWSKYGRGRDPRCDNCMAHCGYEPTAVLKSMEPLRESIRAVFAR